VQYGAYRGDMGRDLTTREREVLEAMIQYAHGPSASEQVSLDSRRRWMAQVPLTRVGRACACGTCPTIDLEDESGSTPDSTRSRIVLMAGSPAALLLLFVDDDRPSCLELAPTEDVVMLEFPPVSVIDFGYPSPT
jgi:hypothetical protein